MVKECIILAGGLGTRLREAVPDLPKCMAPVAGRPFLFYVINYLRSQGINSFTFSLGYKHELIEAYLQANFSSLDYRCVIEDEPLGTGGAIRLACARILEKNVLVTNGDTLFRVDVEALDQVQEARQPLATLALKPMTSFDRYGVVEINDESQVTGFREKKYYDQGLINGGTYLIDVQQFMQLDLPSRFSFETDVLEPQALKGQLAGSVQDGYFIDIGIPEDYKRAGQDLALPPLDLKKIDKSWTLFLDRDGVVNEDAPGTYVFGPDNFTFLEGAPGFFKKLTDLFGQIIVATNQRGVGRKLMTLDDLAAVNRKMTDGIEAAGGKIRNIYAATEMPDTDPLRKPNPGMAFQARHDFPEIDFSRSIMVGNNITDMEFGKNAGMYTVFVLTTSPDVTLPHPDIDLIFPTLFDFAKAL
ncbi:MAG: HAD-IIIA family hydrolase [Chitinophagaceae bacterium]|nr:MAG: HAD-IIIA family hydrolase [Chitinophagaceae bacterium]